MEQVNGLKTLVIKSLTRTFEIDSKFVSIQDVKDYFEVELKIPKHCQVYMHGKREIKDDERILGIFQKFSSEEEKSKKCLYLNLITLEPKERAFYLGFDRFERIGLPFAISVKETLTFGDLEKLLSDMTGYDIALQQQNRTALFSTPKDKCLFTYPSNVDMFFPYRVLKVFVLSDCNKCSKPNKIFQKLVLGRQSRETVQSTMNYNRTIDRTIRCSCGFEMPIELELSNENSEITERTELLDIPPGQDLILRARPTLVTRLKGAFCLY